MDASGKQILENGEPVKIKDIGVFTFQSPKMSEVEEILLTISAKMARAGGLVGDRTFNMLEAMTWLPKVVVEPKGWNVDSVESEQELIAIYFAFQADHGALKN